MVRQRVKHHYGFYVGAAAVVITSLVWVILQRAAHVPRPSELNLEPPEGFSLAMGADDSALFTFVHITDLHLEEEIVERSEKWWTLVNEEIPLIKPVKVFVSGDMTHAAPDYQQEAEWAIYRDALVDAGIFNQSDYIFDIRGNHDTFSVTSWEDEDNFYRTHSVSGAAGLLDEAPHAVFSTSFTHPVTGTVSWTLFDLNAYPGLDTRYNLMVNGWTHEVVDQIEAGLLAPFDDFNDVQHTFAIGHYPTQQYGTGPRKGLSELADDTGFTAYLCGHTHQDDWWLYRPGWAELEVGDFKFKYRYRVYALDNSVLSHVDATVDEWPVVLVTNPKSASFLLEREPLGAIAGSTHIRVLGWSPDNITSGEVELDGEKFCDLAQTGSNGDLWTCEWNPEDFGEGLHDVIVTLVDGAGREGVSTSQFSVDGTHAGLPYKFMDLAAESDWGLYTWSLALLTWLYVFAWKTFGPAYMLHWLQETKQVKLFGRGVRSRLRTDVLQHEKQPDLNGLPVLEPQWVTQVVPVKQFWSVMKLPSAAWWWFAISGLWIIAGPQKIGYLTTENEEGMTGIVWSWGVTVFGEGTFFRWEIWPFNLFVIIWSSYPALVIASWTAYEPFIDDWIKGRSPVQRKQWFQYSRAGLPSLYGLPAAGLVILQLFFLNAFAGGVEFYGLASVIQTIVPNWIALGNVIVTISSYYRSLNGWTLIRDEAGGKDVEQGKPGLDVAQPPGNDTATGSVSAPVPAAESTKTEAQTV